MRVLITRPWEDAEPLAAELRTHGIESIMAPLLHVHYLAGPPLDLAGVQALLVTSANGVRAFAARERIRTLPVYAVGDATAKAAQSASFSAVESASGDVAALAGLVVERVKPAAGTLMHVAGSKVAGDLGGMLTTAGFGYRREVLYEARTADSLPPAATRAIGRQWIRGVIVYSPRTAVTFVKLARQAGLEGACGLLTAFCLSRAVAERMAAIPWKHTVVATRSDQSAMVDAVVSVDK